MNRYSGRSLWTLGALAALFTLAGCASTQPTASQEANERWNAARARIKLQLASDQFTAGNVSSAAGELAEAYRLDPTNPAIVPLQARVLLAKDKIAEAGQLLKQSKLEGTAQAEVEYLTGIVCQQQQRWDKALEAFLRASEIDPGELTYTLAVAQTWLQLGEPLGALEFLTQTASRFVWTGAYHAAVAECHEQLGDWPAAAAAWRRAAGNDHADGTIRLRLAEALYHADRYAQAVAVLTEILDDKINIAPERSQVMLAECYLNLGQATAARDVMEGVVQRHPRDVRALRLWARTLVAVGDSRTALRAARRALDIAPRDSASLELAAALAWHAGDQASAAALAGRLLEIDGQNPVGRRIARQTSAKPGV